MAQREQLCFLDIVVPIETIKFDYNTNLTTRNLKLLLKEKFSDASDIALFYKSTCLDENKTVQEYNINPGDTIRFLTLQPFDMPLELRPISEGHLSQTYLTKNRDMIIKQYILKSNLKIEQYKLLMAEVISYYKLEENESVVKLKGFFKDVTRSNEVKFCIGLEYMNQGSVEKFMTQHGPLSENRVYEIIKVVVGVLIDMHERKIIHRNIRCASIFLKSPNQIKLANFRFSKYLDSTSNAELLGGMPLSVPAGPINWMAPEILEEKEYGCKVDIWAVGMTIIEMLTGRRPLLGLSENESIRIICHDRIKPNTDDPLSDKMQNIINHCLSKNPNDRPKATELLTLLNR